MPAAALPEILTSSLLQRISTNPHLPANTWYFIAGVTLSTLNRPDELSKVYSQAILQDGCTISKIAREEKELIIARRFREGLLKSAAVVGLPKTINALLSLSKIIAPRFSDPPLSMTPTRRSIDIFDVPTSQILMRGQRFFNTVYGKIAQRVMGQMDRCGTPDLGLLARLMYGYVLSNTHLLSPRDTSFLLLAGLIPQDVNPQLKGHLRGALNNGATVEEVRAVRQVCVDICLAAGMRVLKPCEGGWGWNEEVADL